ncbi:MAG: sugar ABC transporter permease [Clostridia bacterium]|nr:sugar ABC transporter permease [Clostridia bacterium]
MQPRNGLKRRVGLSENASFYLLMVPFVSLFFLFTILPVLVSVILSFFSYDTVSMPTFIGFDNFLRMFTEDEVFPKALVNTLKFAVITGPFGFMLSFILGWFINEFSRGFRSFLSFLFYAPALGGGLTLIWSVAFSADSYGYVNNVLMTLGFTTEPIAWFRNETYNTVILMFVQIWGSMGASFLANISGLQNVSQELYEAGALDGIRTRWHELWYITLPSMKSILLFSAVMQIQASFSVGPTITALAGYPSVNNSVDTLVPHLMDVGTARYEMGYAAALSVFLFAMMAITRVLIGKVLDFFGK